MSALDLVPFVLLALGIAYVVSRPYGRKLAFTILMLVFAAFYLPAHIQDMFRAGTLLLAVGLVSAIILPPVAAQVLARRGFPRFSLWTARLSLVLAVLVTLATVVLLSRLQSGALPFVGMTVLGLVLFASAVLSPAVAQRSAQQEYEADFAPQPALTSKVPVHAQSVETGVSSPLPNRSSLVPKITLANIAGMADFKAELKPFLKRFVAYEKSKLIADRNGLLLFGEPGNGKTLIAEAIAGELKLPFLKIGVDDISSKWIGAPVERLAEVVAKAKALAPCVLFFDEFDALAASRDTANAHEETKKLVNALLTSIDDMRRLKIVLIAATNHFDSLDAAVVRDGRFDFKMEVPMPDLAARQGIIGGLVKKYNVGLALGVQDALAAHWVQRSPAFMDGAFKRVRDEFADQRGHKATLAEMKDAGRKACRREGSIPKDCPSVDQLVLTAPVRAKVESLIYRMGNWEHVVAQGGSAPKGVVLYGPPGTGKTSLVRSIARSLKVWHVFEVNTAEILMDPRKFKDVIQKAKTHRPSIVFLDEGDELLQDRSTSTSPSATATNEILKAMDGMMASVPEVVFVVATNRMDVIDEAALRGGRFDEQIYLPRYTGEDLSSFIRNELATRPKVRLADGLTAGLIADELGEAAPADVKDLISKAVNHTLVNGGSRPITIEDIRLVMA